MLRAQSHSLVWLGLDAGLERRSGNGGGRGRGIGKWRRRGSVEKEEARFEIDGAKAREALKQLDQQLQSLSQPPPPPPPPLPTKPPSPPEPDFDRDFITRGRREEMPQISDSYLAYTAGALVILTIFNNIIFNTFIKPSVDGYEKPIKIERVPLSEPD